MTAASDERQQRRQRSFILPTTTAKERRATTDDDDEVLFYLVSVAILAEGNFYFGEMGENLLFKKTPTQQLFDHNYNGDTTINACVRRCVSSFVYSPYFDVWCGARQCQTRARDLFGLFVCYCTQLLFQ